MHLFVKFSVFLVVNSIPGGNIVDRHGSYLLVRQGKDMENNRATEESGKCPKYFHAFRPPIPLVALHSFSFPKESMQILRVRPVSFCTNPFAQPASAAPPFHIMLNLGNVKDLRTGPPD